MYDIVHLYTSYHFVAYSSWYHEDYKQHNYSTLNCMQSIGYRLYIVIANVHEIGDKLQIYREFIATECDTKWPRRLVINDFIMHNFTSARSMKCNTSLRISACTQSICMQFAQHGGMLFK